VTGNSQGSLDSRRHSPAALISYILSFMEKLFTYGTLQSRSVQFSIYRRVVECHSDAISGYCIRTVTVRSWKHAGVKGNVQKTIERGDGEIDGTVLLLTPEELQRTDDYEPKGYVRIKVPIKSGGEAWVYHLATPTNYP
jgi:Gamma-glutamyl cyclotransferase, AIG2-like